MNMWNAERGIEAANDSKRKKEISPITFLHAFTRDYVDNRPSTVKNQLIEEVMNQDSLSWTLASKWLAEFRASDEKYNEIELDKIDVYMLRKQLAKWYLSLKQSRENLEQYILREYEVNSDEYNNKIASSVKNLSPIEISRLTRNNNELQKFLKKELSRDSVPTRVKLDVFQWVSESQMQARFNGLSEDEKKELRPILVKLGNGKTPREDEMRALIESPLLSSDEKVRFIHTFLPYITLRQAVDTGLISESEAEDKKKKYTQKVLDGVSLDSDRKDELISQITIWDIRIKTKDIVTSGDNAVSISKNIWFTDFTDSLENQSADNLNTARLKWPSSFDQMLALIGDMNSNNRFKNLQYFAAGNIIKFTKAWAEQEEINYVKIDGYDDEKREFTFRSVWGNTLDLSSPWSPESLWYLEFIESLKKSNSTSFEAIDSDMLNAQIRSGNVETSNLQTLSAADFDGSENIERKNELKLHEIERLREEISEKRNQLSLTEDAAKKKELEQEIERLETFLVTFSNTDISSENAAEIYNRNKFLEKLNELDNDGIKLWFKRWVSFTTGKKMGDEWSGTYTLLDNPNYEAWTVSFYSQAWTETANLSSFLEKFKESWAKRTKSILSPEEIISENSSFEGYEFSDGKFIAKDEEDLAGKKADREAKYLASTTGDTIVKINDFSGNFVNVQVGERETITDEKKLRKNEKSKDLIKIKGATHEQWTLDELNRYIEEQSLVPDWKIWENLTIVPKDQQNSIKNGFKWNAWSLYEIIAGWKTVVEWITESLSRWSHVKSAHAALAMWKFLPWELKDDLQAKVEAAESEEMDKALKQLGAVDSWMAVARIEKWLKNRATSEAKKEAWILFMLEKYWHLTSKWKLYPYRWKFLWYEALGGKIWDALYLDTKKQVEADGQVFSEEKLVHMLLKKQCYWHWFNGIHRRSRLHKEYENKWKSWVNDEFEKWEKDASNFRNAKTMVREGMGEATGGTTSNAFWWAKKAVDRGGSLEDMMHIPSAILLSWAAFDLDQVTYNKVKSLWDGEGQPVITFLMYSSKQNMQMYNKVVNTLSHEIEAAYPTEFAGIWKRADDLYKMWLNRKEKEKVRLEAANKFWQDYGEVLSRALNINLSSDGKFDKTDDIIRRKKETISEFWQYHELLEASPSMWNAFKKDYVEDWAGETWIYGININGLTKKYLDLSQGWGFRNWQTATNIWLQIKEDVNATPKKLFVWNDINSPENRAAQEGHLVDIFEQLIGGYLEIHGANQQALRGMNNPTTSLWSALNSWWINMLRDLYQSSSEEVEAGWRREYFRKVAGNIISWNTGGTGWIPEVLQRTKSETSANLNPPLRD